MEYFDKLKSMVRTFTITKTTIYGSADIVKNKMESLDLLKSETFNRIKVPNFDYSVDWSANEISITADFIKGVYLEQPQIIFEDMVKRQSEYTVHNYAKWNYIVCERTDEIYLVDLDEYMKIPIEERINYFNKQWENYI